MSPETKKILLKDVCIPILTAIIGAALGAVITGKWFSDSLIINIDGESITVHSAQYEELVEENASMADELASLIAESNNLKDENDDLKKLVQSLEAEVNQYESNLDSRDTFDTKRIRLLENGLERELTESTLLLFNNQPFFPLSTLVDVYPDMITYDSNALTITLGEIVPEKGYLLDVCSPYQTDDKYQSPAYMTMCGETYTNGIQMNWDAGYSYYNLNKKYNVLEFDLGHIDGGAMVDGTLEIYLDGQFAEKFDLSSDSLVQHYTLVLDGANQMQFVWKGNRGNAIINFGMANISIG